MINVTRHIILLVFISLLFSTELFSDEVEIITNSTIRSDDYISIIIKVKNTDQTINTSINGTYQISPNNATFENDVIEIKKGIGSVSTNISATDDFNISINGFSGEKLININNDIPIIEIQGTISENITWSSENIYHITSDLTVTEEAELIIQEGTRVLIDEKVNMHVAGNLKIIGSAEYPVTFSPMNINEPWGGIIVSNNPDTVKIEHAIFHRGGNNENFIFGHSNSQAVVMTDHSNAVLQNCYFIDNPGKAIGSNTSIIKVNDCIISRCDTGGEYHFSQVTIANSWYIDIPIDDNVIIDDDNDGSYFYGVHPSITTPSLIDNCFFISGKDDGIDHNGAILTIENSWIDGYSHEGIAASNNNSVTVFNTLVKNCEQGIEAGYGTPLLTIDHCVLIGNDVGLRFGDSYYWGCEGHIDITNTIIFDNSDNIKNFDFLTQGPVPDGIDISWSMTNDPDYNNSPACITGVPIFDEEYMLIPGSPGFGQSNDDGNMGLINKNLNGYYINEFEDISINIFPNPCNEKVFISVNLPNSENITLTLMNSSGLKIIEKKYTYLLDETTSFPLNIDHLQKGIYFIVMTTNDLIITKKLIKTN